MSKFKDTANDINKKISAMYIAMTRPDTPLYAKIAVGLCVWYALSPLDVVPDFIPVLGQVDDIIILPFLMWLALKLMPEDIMEECMQAVSENRTADTKFRKRYMIPVLAVWALLLFWIVNLVNTYMK